MRLTRLDVKGFKSFADRTEFDFDSDLTGIVGPNGCGKSNVVDALKWVLGDQRAKSLRGAEMTDVIFKGAEGRDGAQACEVSITLQSQGEADDEALGGRSEVKIGRRLTRDKESTYLLNGEPVRLKDVRDLLMDTGLGVGAYSVMEQGRIDAVLSANPDQRRAIFEEAAGISRFKLQKRETLRRLERTEANLARAKDLLEDRTRRIRGLKVQAGRARRYLELQSRLSSLWASVAVAESAAIRAKEAEAAEVLTSADEELKTCEERLGAVRDEVAHFDEQIAAAEAVVQEASEELRSATSERDAKAHRAHALEERVEQLEAEKERCAERREPLAEARAEREDKLQASRTRLEELEAESIELGKEVEQHREAVKTAQSSVRTLGQSLEEARKGVLRAMHERATAKNRILDQQAVLRAASTRAGQIAGRTESLADETAAVQEVHDQADRTERRLKERSRSFEEREQKARSALEIADREAAELGKVEAGLRERLASSRSNLELLQGLEAGFEGLDQGPRHLLETKPNGLRGRLLDVVEVDLEFGRALEAALGPYVQALIVETRAQAEAMLAQLREEKKGKALLLVAAEFDDKLMRPPTFALPDGAEFLYSKVRCPREAWPMVQWLLRGVCLVDSSDDAVPTRTDLCFVTRDGTTLCGPRIEGGSETVGGGGLVVRRAQIQSLSDEVGELEGEVDGVRNDRRSATDRVRALGDRVARLGGVRAATAERVRRQGEERERAQKQLLALARERDDLAAEASAIEREQRSVRSKLNDDCLRELCGHRLEALHKRDEDEHREALDKARDVADHAVTHEQELRLRQTRVRTDRDGVAKQLHALEESLRELDTALDDLGRRQEEATAGAESARQESAQLRTEAEQLESRVQTSEEARAAASAQLEEARAGRGSRREELAEREGQRDALSRSRSQAEIAVADARNRFERIEERLREDSGLELRHLLGEIGPLLLVPEEVTGPRYGPAAPLGTVECLYGPVVPPARARVYYELERLWLDEDFDLAACQKEAQGMRGQRDRLGSVNLNAVDELQNEEGLLGTVEQDVADLEESRRSLMEALRQMERESRALFERTFEVARENFRTIFRKLFQGGKADMFLEETDDALESGIEIVAKPPGKELQSIALLSGGERSLTALAILFAVFQVKPSPFCILDEVDAALDETNVERFLRVLDGFVGPSQFCIVTHHKRTMAACQVLYGITMQKRGVSSRISVQLGEVDEFNREPTYEKAVSQRIAGEEQVGF